MSVCTFIAADCPLPVLSPTEDFHVCIDVTSGEIRETPENDNLCLLAFDDVESYTDKKYGVSIEWPQYTPARAEKLIEYIKDALCHTDTVELWHVWLMGWYEYDERPIRRRKAVSVCDLTAEDIQALCNSKVIDPHDIRPTFHCLEIS